MIFLIGVRHVSDTSLGFGRKEEGTGEWEGCILWRGGREGGRLSVWII